MFMITNTNHSNKLIEMGFCRNPHGIKGEFSFSLFNVEDSIVKTGTRLTLVPLEGSTWSLEGEEFVIEKIRFGNKVIAKLKGIDDRNTVEQMIPFTIMVNRSDFPALDDSEVYLVDLIGFKVVDHCSNKIIGEIQSFYDNGAQTIITMALGDDKQIEVPFVEEFIVKVDQSNRAMEIKLPHWI